MLQYTPNEAYILSSILLILPNKSLCVEFSACVFGQGPRSRSTASECTTHSPAASSEAQTHNQTPERWE